MGLIQILYYFDQYSGYKLCYLGILCQIIEGSDVKLELSSFGELAEANTKTQEILTAHIFSSFQNRLSSDFIYKHDS